MLETLQMMGAGFVGALTPINLLMMAFGVTIGMVIGCLPGLSAAMGVALVLPLTFTMKADTGLIVLGAIYCGAIFGGSISAILIHTPGTPASAATAIEGYQMTLQGKAGKALDRETRGKIKDAERASERVLRHKKADKLTPADVTAINAAREALSTVAAPLVAQWESEK